MTTEERKQRFRDLADRIEEAGRVTEAGYDPAYDGEHDDEEPFFQDSPCHCTAAHAEHQAEAEGRWFESEYAPQTMAATLDVVARELGCDPGSWIFCGCYRRETFIAVGRRRAVADRPSDCLIPDADAVSRVLRAIADHHDGRVPAEEDLKAEPTKEQRRTNL